MKLIVFSFYLIGLAFSYLRSSTKGLDAISESLRKNMLQVQNSSSLDEDFNTFSNYKEVKTLHFDLNWNIDFQNSLIISQVTLNMKSLKDGLNEVHLDMWGQSIKNVYFQLNSEPKQQIDDFKVVTFSDQGDQGEQLKISLQSALKNDQTFKLIIDYVISDSSKAISFLTKEQTSTKTQPYLFSQCEPIYARSMIPLQDTPMIKSTYNSQVSAPLGINVYMSANKTKVETSDDVKIHYFENQIPTPSYLVAIVAGNVQQAQIGKRTYVITEPDIMQKSLEDLADLEEYLETVEDYIQIPYIWGSYKIVIMPPSFPIGGMENPLLTFASPSIITGDKSGTTVAIHEIAHSWTGNMVTCGNWSSLWLNEGFTVFLERKAQLKLFGQDFMYLDSIVGNNSLTSDFKYFGFQSNFSSLFPLVKQRNPDDAFSTVPYEKGYQFLYFIQDIIGVQQLRDFLTSWVDANTFKSRVWEDLREAFNAYLPTIFSAGEVDKIKKQIDWEAWILQAGEPPKKDMEQITFKTKQQTQAQDLAQEFIDDSASRPANWEEEKTFSINQKNIMIEYMGQNISQVTVSTLTLVDQCYDYSNALNFEVRWRWYELSILVGYNQYKSTIYEFLGEIGRQKMILPIYKAYVATNQRDYAIECFNHYYNFYHPIARISIAAVLGV